MTTRVTRAAAAPTAPAAEVDAGTWVIDILRESHTEWLAARSRDLERWREQPAEREELVARMLCGVEEWPGPVRDGGADDFETELTAFRERALTGEGHPYLLLRAAGGAAEDEAEPGGLTAIAVGVDAAGRRAILGISALEDSTRTAWSHFLADLVRRGLSGVRLVVTDPQAGIKGAVVHTLPSAALVRSRKAVLRDVLASVPDAERGLVAILVGSIYEQASAEEVVAHHARVVRQLRSRSPQAADRMEDAFDDIFALHDIPTDGWQRVWRSIHLDRSADERVRITRLQSNFFVVAPAAKHPSGARRPAPQSVIEGVASVADRPQPPAWKPWLRWARPKLPITHLGNILALPTAFPNEGEAHSVARSRAWPATLLVGGVLVLGFLGHAINLFNFPRYELDEGTYLSSAWAVLNDQITAYPYGYGHPPLGWIQIAVWTMLTGGFFTFGDAINSGRVLMVLYDAGSSLLVYLIAQRLTGRRAVGLLAMTIFTFSPLSLLYQRQVFLDNISVFWLLLSVYLVIVSKSRMRYLVGAGLAFGCALLSKETIALFIPVMIYGLWLNLSRYQRLFGLITFTYTVFALGFSLILLALIKGELFPYAWHLPWDHHPHLSLLDTLAVQVRRSQSEGSLIEAWTQFWMNSDPWLITAGIGATAFNLFVGIWQRQRLFIALASVSYWLLLLRGGVVLPFYVIMLLPLAALNTALAIDTVLNAVRKYRRYELLSAVVVGCLAVTFLADDAVRAEPIFTQSPTAAQTQAVTWIRNHVSRDSVVVINSYLYMDLRQAGGEGVGTGATFPFAHVYWNIAYDPELHDGLLQGNWDRIDYIVADSEMLRDITTLGGPMTVIDVALQHSVLLEEFRTNDNERLEKNAPPADAQIVISVYEVVHRVAPASPFSSS